MINYKDKDRIEELETICAEAYQVIGCLVGDKVIPENIDLTKILDNLSCARLEHKDVLPFVIPHYEKDEGHLSPETLSEIKEKSSATNIDAARFTKSLVGDTEIDLLKFVEFDPENISKLDSYYSDEKYEDGFFVIDKQGNYEKVCLAWEQGRNNNYRFVSGCDSLSYSESQIIWPSSVDFIQIFPENV